MGSLKNYKTKNANHITTYLATNLLTEGTSVGCGILRTASTFLGSGLIPSDVKRCPM